MGFVCDSGSGSTSWGHSSQSRSRTMTLHRDQQRKRHRQKSPLAGIRGKTLGAGAVTGNGEHGDGWQLGSSCGEIVGAPGLAAPHVDELTRLRRSLTTPQQRLDGILQAGIMPHAAVSAHHRITVAAFKCLHSSIILLHCAMGTECSDLVLLHALSISPCSCSLSSLCVLISQVAPVEPPNTGHGTFC